MSKLLPKSMSARMKNFQISTRRANGLTDLGPADRSGNFLSNFGFKAGMSSFSYHKISLWDKKVGLNSKTYSSCCKLRKFVFSTGDDNFLAGKG